MGKIFKRALATIMVVLMVLTSAPLSGFVDMEWPELNLPDFSSWFSTEAEAASGEYSNSEYQYGNDGKLTRIQWLHNLTVVFGFTVAEDNLPDNYYADIAKDSDYYKDVMIATEYGLIDIEAGGDVLPDELATREFAARTLNHCLNYVIDTDTYSFSDTEAVTYDADAQVAINRGWFSLVSGKFMPEQAVTKLEAQNMYKDAAEVIASEEIDEDAETIAEFAVGVKVIDNDVLKTVEDDTLTLFNYNDTISIGDVLAVYQGDLPALFKASKVVKTDNKTIVTLGECDDGEYINDLVSQGTAEADLGAFEAADGVDFQYIPAEETAAYAARGVSVTKGKDCIVAHVTFGNWFEMDCTVSNVNIIYDYDLKKEEYMVKITGNISVTTRVTTSVSSQLAELPSILEIGSLNFWGIGKVGITVPINITGSLTTTYKGNFVGGFQSKKDSFRLITELRKNDFTSKINVTASVGVKLFARLDILSVIRGTAYIEYGLATSYTNHYRGEGKTPQNCETSISWLYAKYGATVTLGYKKLAKSFGDNITLYDKNNSPCRSYYHWEDGQGTAGCTVTYSTTGKRSYYTRYYSRYGATYGNYGFDDYGEPVAIYNYSLDDDGNATITGCNGNAGILDIPETIDGHKVVAIGSNSFKGKDHIRSVIIPDSVTSIGFAAFKSCENLSKVTLSKGLIDFSEEAFAYCNALTSIEIPKSLTTMNGTSYNSFEPGVFYKCQNLKTVTFETGTTKVVDRLFANCLGLESITIPDTVTIIESEAFLNCQNLKEIKFSNSLTNIGSSAFKSCTSLENIVIPDSVTSIGFAAFKSCENLSKVTLSKGLIDFSEEAFAYCNALTSIEIPKSLTTMNGTSYNSFEPGVFYGCENLKTATFEKGTVKVVDRLFANCPGLESVTIPDTVTVIEGEAFLNCQNLKNVVLPGSLETINTAAFKGCSKLQSIIIPNTVTGMGESVFRGCTSLKSAKLPNIRVNIPSYIFADCSSLEKIEFPSTIKTVQTNAFLNCTSLKEIVFNDGLECINESAFRNCDALTTITVPNSVTSIGSSVFYDCDTLTNVTLGTGLTSLPASTFEHCDALVSIDLPYRTASIGNNAFKDCVKFTTITIPRATTSIGSNVFSYPTRLTINGVAGTYAETYAKQIGAKFVDKQVNATAVTIDKPTVTLNKGQSIKLVMSVNPSNFTDEVSWKSGNTDIATIAADGTLTAKSVGTATIKLTVGSVSATCKVTVVQPVTSVNIDKSSVTMQALETYQLKLTVNPDNAADKTVEWSSSASDIASVDQNGLVTAHKKGEATIRVDAKDGSGKYDTCKIVVSNNGVIATNVSELESAHNYPVNCTDFWQYTLSGADSISVTFDSRTNIEDGFDYLYIYDGNKNQVGKYTGTELSDKSITVSGDTVRIQLVSDDSGTDWGFKVTDVKIASTHEHSYTSKTTKAATCTESGFTTYTCSVCNNSYTTDEVPSLGHNLNYIINIEPSCNQQGYKLTECLRCGICEESQIEATGHTDDNEDGYCDFCYDSSCDCMCHKTGFVGILWKIFKVLFKSFNANSICTCGQAHY